VLGELMMDDDDDVDVGDEGIFDPGGTTSDGAATTASFSESFGFTGC